MDKHYHDYQQAQFYQWQLREQRKQKRNILLSILLFIFLAVLIYGFISQSNKTVTIVEQNSVITTLSPSDNPALFWTPEATKNDTQNALQGNNKLVTVTPEPVLLPTVSVPTPQNGLQGGNTSKEKP